jgi:hypothetical protein
LRIDGLGYRCIVVQREYSLLFGLPIEISDVTGLRLVAEIRALTCLHLCDLIVREPF